MPYWQLFYHIVWSTAERLPLLTPKVEGEVHQFLRAKAQDLEGVVFAVNGMPDHVHLVVSIPPKVAVAHFIGQIKAVASTKHNSKRLQDSPLAWQGEYGVFSFDGKRLPNYVRYVERQKEHHAEGTTLPILERTHDGPVRRLAENAAAYTTDDEAWRGELLAWKPFD
jgi:REP element-mobilizing transposase RayT